MWSDGGARLQRARRGGLLLALGWLLGSAGWCQGATTWYVDQVNGSDGNLGSNGWSSAFKTFTNAVAKSSTSAGDTINVAAGTYTWTNTAGLSVGNQTILGGYPAGGGARDWATNPAILDGGNACRAFNKTATGMFTLDGFTIRNCTNSAAGGAITVSAGALNLYNCTFVTNYAYTSGGAIYHNAATSNTFSNCTFIANSAAGGSGFGGGAIFFAAASTNVFQSCAFVTNAASGQGGAIYTGARLDQYTGCGFTNNTAASAGGAIWISGSGSRHVFSNCTFTTNRQASGSGWGGAICNGSTYVTNVWQSCVFVANVSAYRGGAIGEAQSAVAGSLNQFTGCVFSNNVSSYEGGAIMSDAPMLDLSGGGNVFYGNTCTSSEGGGAIGTRLTSYVAIRNSAFIANKANGANGGALYISQPCTSVVVNCTFFTNSTTGQGGAVYLGNASDVLNVTNCIFWGNASGGTGTNIQNAGTVNLAYSDIATNANAVTGGTKNFGAGITNCNPLFASTTAPYDVHLQSQYGRWTSGGWVTDSQTSPLIDAGDPNSDYSHEPKPSNGIELGAYGNTPQASKSRFAGTMLLVW